VSNPKTSSEQWLYEEYSFDVMAMQNLKRLWKREIAESRMTINIAGERVWKAIVEVVPAAAPNFTVESQKQFLG